MATTPTSINASELMRILQSEVASSVYYHGEDGRASVMNVFPIMPLEGGDALRYPIIVQGNGSYEQYGVGEDLPVAGTITPVQAVQPWLYSRTVAEIERRVYDDARGTAIGGRLIQEEIEGAMRALMAGFKVDLLSTAATGLLGIVDATTALGQLSRTTYTSLRSYVQSPSGALTMAHMNNLRVVGGDAPFAAQYKAIISRPNLRTQYLAFAPQQASGGTTPLNVNMADLSGPRNIDLGWKNTSFDGAPWFEMLDLANTVILALDPSGVRYHPHRDWEVLEIPSPRDSRIFQFSVAGALSCPRPRKQAKIDTLTP